MYYVYILWSQRLRKRYIGSTEYLERRVLQHNKGYSRFTKSGIPWQVIHTEKYDSIEQARKREHYLKGGTGRRWLDEFYPNYRRGARVVE